jgi:MFS family permease
MPRLPQITRGVAESLPACRLEETPIPPATSRFFGTTSFLNDTASEMAYWILTSLGAGPAAPGLIEGIAESVASFAKLFSGYLTDRLRRRKPIVVFGYALANIMKPVLAVTHHWWHVLLVRFADRMAKGIRGAPRDVMLAESADPAKMGSAFGLLQAMDSAGAIAGPLIALLLISRLGFRGVFWVAAVPGLLSVIVIATLARETGHSKSSGKPRSVRTLMDHKAARGNGKDQVDGREHHVSGGGQQGCVADDHLAARLARTQRCRRG